MVTIDEEIKHLKNECKDMNYYKKKLKEAELKLEEIKVRLQGVSSPRLEGVYIVKDPHKSDKLYWLEVEKEWAMERDKYQNIINELNRPIDSMPDILADAFRSAYIDKINHDKVAESYGFKSRQDMYDKINDALKNYFLLSKPKNVL